MENKYVEVDLSETDHQPCESQESGDNLANIFKLGSNRSLYLTFYMSYKYFLTKPKKVTETSWMGTIFRILVRLALGRSCEIPSTGMF